MRVAASSTGSPARRTRAAWNPGDGDRARLQYRHCLAIFYGGGRSILSDIFDRKLGRAVASRLPPMRGKLPSIEFKILAGLDYHAGLGPWRYATKIIPAARERDFCPCAKLVRVV